MYYYCCMAKEGLVSKHLPLHRPRCFYLTCFAAADANAFCFRYRGAATFHSFSCKAYRRKPQNDDKYPVQSRHYNVVLDQLGSREDALSPSCTPTGWLKKQVKVFFCAFKYNTENQSLQIMYCSINTQGYLYNYKI